jgi:hypothetical protein
MINGIVDAQVFDPALSSLEDEAIPARIELVVSPSVNLEDITFEKEGPDWTIYHYGRFMKIEPFNPDDDWEVADFNMSGMFPEAVVPVTIVIETRAGNFLEDYYVRFTEARQIVDQINMTQNVINSCGQYILVPNEAWAKENKVAFRLQHTRHTCIRCFREKYGSRQDVPGALEHLALPVGKPIEVQSKRMLDLCEDHILEHRGQAKARRLGIDN